MGGVMNQEIGGITHKLSYYCDLAVAWVASVSHLLLDLDAHATRVRQVTEGHNTRALQKRLQSDKTLLGIKQRLVLIETVAELNSQLTHALIAALLATGHETLKHATDVSVIHTEHIQSHLR